MICLTPFQCHFVGFALNIANKLTENAMSGLVQFAKYINAPIVAIYKVSGPKHFFPLSHGLNSSFFRSNDLTTIRELSGCAASIKTSLGIFECKNFDVGKCLVQYVQPIDQEKRWFLQYFSYQIHL